MTAHLAAPQPSDDEPIASVRTRHRVRVTGELRAVAYQPWGGGRALLGELVDDTGSLDLLWLGRREVAGIVPGRRLRARGTVSGARPRPTIFNPAYELIDEDP